MTSYRKQLQIRLDLELEAILDEILSYYPDPKPPISYIIRGALNYGLFKMRNQLKDGSHKGPIIKPLKIFSDKDPNDSI